MAEPEQIEQPLDELAQLVEQARRAEVPPLHGAQQYRMVRGALRESRATRRLLPRVTRFAVGLAAALLMGLLGARAFEAIASRLATNRIAVAPFERPLRLWLRTGDALVLAPDTAVDLVAEEPARRALRLQRGALLCDVRPLTRGERFELRTPHARVQVRGTVFSVQVDAHETTVQVHEGAVYVAARVLRAGERWSSRGSAAAFDHDLFAAEVRDALGARGIAPSRDAPSPHVSPVVEPTTTTTPATASAAPLPAPHTQETATPDARACRRAAEPVPPSLEAAHQLLREGRTEELLSLLGAQRSEPAYARVYADALRASGDFDRAIGAYEALADQSEGSTRDQAGYAAAQLALGPLRDPLRALRVLERFELTDPSSALHERAQLLRVESLLALGRSDEARAAARAYLAREPHTQTSERLRTLVP